MKLVIFAAKRFLSTPSARRATVYGWVDEGTFSFLSTPSARRATQQSKPRKRRSTISIHALREEGDNGNQHGRTVCRISIHALREEGDQDWCEKMGILPKFLSTPSARRATLFYTNGGRWVNNFYPRPPREGRLMVNQKIRINHHFYPRPPREGRQRQKLPGAADRRNFYPRPPREGRLRQPNNRVQEFKISIHALREKGDITMVQFITGEGKFLSTPSARRATRTLMNALNSCTVFLSTPSARRATGKCRKS